MTELREFCFRCDKVTPSKIVRHASGTEYLCAVCGWQVDFDVDDYDDYEDDGEPTGSCEECGTNLYGDEAAFEHVCDQCLWSLSMGASRSNEDIPY